MGVETLWRRPAGIFRYRIRRPAFRLASRRTLRRTLELWHGPRRPRHRGRRRRIPFGFAAQANGSEPLHQGHAALLRMIVGEFAALRPDFVLRWYRKLVHTRHEIRAQRGELTDDHPEKRRM